MDIVQIPGLGLMGRFILCINIPYGHIYMCLGQFLAFLAVLFGSYLACWGLLVSFS